MTLGYVASVSDENLASIFMVEMSTERFSVELGYNVMKGTGYFVSL
jgi:hypothetical protein